MNSSSQTIMDEIETMESPFKVKFFLIKLCIEYDPLQETLDNNIQFMERFTKLFMVHKILFKKKEDKMTEMLERFDSYLEGAPGMTHCDFLPFLKLGVLVSILKTDALHARKIHQKLMEFLEIHGLKSGVLRDAYEHDCLDYQVGQLDTIMEIVFYLERYGFYSFNYLTHKNSVGFSLLKSFMILTPFVHYEKKHFMFVRSIFQQDKKHPLLGQVWSPEKAIQLLQKYSHLHKKIEEILKTPVSEN
jgi:hypothetical protein